MRNYPGSLHNHTDFSNIRLRDCINKIPDLINYAIELGHEVVAITDHETLSSFIQVEEYAEKIKEKHPDFKVIRGNEIYLTRNNLNAQNFNKDKGDDYYHFVLLAKDIEGYHQLCELSTRAWLRSYVARRMRRVPTYYRDLKEIILPNQGHLIGSSACLGGRLPRYLLQYFETENPEYRDVAKRWCVYMRDLFGEGNFYLELQPSHNPQQIFVNKQLLEISNELGIPYIITTDSHYLKKTDADIHEKYLNSQDGDREVKSFYASTYMMSTEELESYFPYFSPAQFETAYNNIRAIAAACQNYSIKRPLRIPHLPWLAYNHNVANIEFYLNKMPSLRKFLASKRSADHELVYAVIDGIQRHQDLQNNEAYEALEECLDMTWISSEVNNAEWSAYYLNLQKIIGECWNAGTIVGPARGSGGGFVLLYCLDIIQMNKLREHTKLFPWRFLNPARVSVLDVDVDISGLKRGQVLQHLRAVYGEDRVSNVSTFRTEKSKSAILTAARGLDLPPEEGQYLASLVNAERGQLFSLHTMYYGDENDNIPPSSTFIEEMNKHPDVWEVAQKIEGLICGLGIHAGGVVFNDEPFTNTASLMRAPDGTIVSGFELHDLEKCSLIKYDVLSVEGMDKIQICLELLQQYGYIDSSKSLREIYEDTIGIYNIDRTSEDMWKMVWEHKIISLFQMEQQSGIQAIAKTHPTSVDDLATINSVIRLMAQEKGGESPIDKYARFREHPEQWEEEMTQYGLTAEEKKILHKELDISCGLSIAQEQFMELVQMPEIGGFDLQWSDRLRKSIAKKNPKDYEQLTKEFYENMRQKHLSEHLCSYVWQVLIAMNRGYGFNSAHTLGYSLVGLQEMNLAYKYPIIFWNTANLIVDSAGKQETEEGDPECIIVELEDASESTEEIVDIYEPEEWEDYEYVDLPDRSGKKKIKKNKSVNFGKIATAIGKFQSEGITVLPPDINESGFTFTPIVEKNAIASGLRNITRISADLVNEIIAHRPYTSIEDFLDKIHANCTQMLNLIKCGAFDNLYSSREEVMELYLHKIAKQLKVVNLATVPTLIDKDLFPEEFTLQKIVYSFNKALKQRITKGCYPMNSKMLDFYCEHFDVDQLATESSIPIKAWEKQYNKFMDTLRQYLKEHAAELLQALNAKFLEETRQQYATGSISKWEIDSMSFYYHPHELSSIDFQKYSIQNFFAMPQDPVIDRRIPTKDGKTIDLYQLTCICGTVLDKNKLKNSISLLTPTGVVNVKIWKNQFAKYDKQISEIQPDGKKKVCEKSWFTRGNLLYLQGIRRGDAFIPKAYKSSPHKCPIMKITAVDGSTFLYTDKRYDE